MVFLDEEFGNKQENSFHYLFLIKFLLTDGIINHAIKAGQKVLCHPGNFLPLYPLPLT